MRKHQHTCRHLQQQLYQKKRQRRSEKNGQVRTLDLGVFKPSGSFTCQHPMSLSLHVCKHATPASSVTSAQGVTQAIDEVWLQDEKKELQAGAKTTCVLTNSLYCMTVDTSTASTEQFWSPLLLAQAMLGTAEAPVSAALLRLCGLHTGTEVDGDADGINLAAPKRRKRTWEEASDGEEADPEVLEAARKEAEMEVDR